MRHTDDQIHDSACYLDPEFKKKLEVYFNSSPGTVSQKMRNFAKYVPRQSLSRFLLKSEIFKKILNTQGVLIECGVLAGGGLMTWAQLSSIFEPLNTLRTVIGFDTFEGFPEVVDEDESSSEFLYEGALAVDSYEDIETAASVHMGNKLCLKGRNQVRLIRGDATETIPQYLQDNPATVVALLYLDFDIYKPTKAALEAFLPRMPKGAVIVFDELSDDSWPGETIAVLETVGIRNLRIRRFTHDTSISYAVLE